MSDTLMQEKADLGTGEPRPDLDGLQVAKPGDVSIWLIANGGYRKGIPGDTYLNLFLPNSTVVRDINVTSIPEQAGITSGAILARGAGSTVYLMTNGTKWPITAGGFKRYQFNPAKIVDVPQILLDFIPDGPDIDWPQ